MRLSCSLKSGMALAYATAPPPAEPVDLLCAGADCGAIFPTNSE